VSASTTLADGELLFSGTPADLMAQTSALEGGDLEQAFVALLKAKGL
jgi:2-keto-4-pentenoate hydratase/2-oxohepta-3-ene-1,7-dioic acid hydratase in catechol pathway